MAWGQPKRNSKCQICGQRGRCSCHRRISAQIAADPGAAPHPCPVTLPNGKTCGRTVRGGVCPSPDH